jgi:pimeloyl-ACP methyl ester carboxylesterase
VRLPAQRLSYERVAAASLRIGLKKEPVQDWIEANEVSLRCGLSGRTKRPLVLIHELGGALEGWGVDAPALSGELRIVHYDQRGFGRPEKTRGVFSCETIVGDLIAPLDALGIVGRLQVPAAR